MAPGNAATAEIGLYVDVTNDGFTIHSTSTMAPGKGVTRYHIQYPCGWVAWHEELRSVPCTYSRGVMGQQEILKLRRETPGDWQTYLARTLLFFLLFEIPGLSFVPVSIVPAVCLLALNAFSSTYRMSSRLWVLLWLSVAAAINGLILRELAKPTFMETAPLGSVASMLVWLASFAVLVPLALWCFERVDVLRGLTLVFAGALAPMVLQPGDLQWKGSPGIYATLLVLALVGRMPTNVTRLVLIGASVLNVVNDSRAMALFCFAALVLTFLTASIQEKFRTRPKQTSAILLAAMLLFAQIAYEAMVRGWLGQQLQERTVKQMARAGNIILGGRTEWAASLSLFNDSPWGHGVAVNPSTSSIRHALNEVRKVGGDYTNDYYWHELVFGTRFDLHSIFVDLWSHFGGAGVLLAVWVGWTLFRALPVAVGLIHRIGTAPTLAILVGGWDLLFSPMGNAERLVLALAVSVALLALPYLFKQKRPQPRTTPVTLVRA